MTLKNLKSAIANGMVGDELLVFVCQGDAFIANEYVDAICERKALSKRYAQTLAETTRSALSLVMDYSSEMTVIKTETFTEASDDYYEYKNCAVICKKIDKAIAEDVKPFVINVPKIQDWQAKDYATTKCRGLAEADAAWLWDASEGDIYKIDGVLDMLLLLDEKDRSASMRRLCSDMFAKKQVFDLVDALVKQDKETVGEFIRRADDYTNLDPVGLTTLALAKFRNIALLCYRSGVKEADLGMSSGAIWHIKNDNRCVPLPYINRAIEFLSNIDSRLKANPCALDFVDSRKNAFFEYIALGLLARGEAK